MRWIYISPHLDDAILSCGGLIHKQSESRINVEVWTICAGDPPEGRLSPFAIEQHDGYPSGEEYLQNRRSEDIHACQLVGARHRHLPFQDCIFRQSADGGWLYASEEAIFGDMSSDDEPTMITITEYLKTILRPTDIVVSPMAVGNHVDHQIVRKALDELNHPVRFYADIPYAIRHKEDFFRISKDYINEPHKLAENNISCWQEAIRAYSSQIKVLFGNSEKMVQSIDNYSKFFTDFHLWIQKQLS